MAFDKSGTRNQVILAVGFGTIGALIALKFVFDSYFLAMTESTVHDNILKSPPEAVIRLREDERHAFERAPMSLEQAFRALGQGRESSGEKIAPQPSEDLGAMKGWSLSPKAFDSRLIEVRGRGELLPSDAGLLDGSSPVVTSVIDSVGSSTPLTKH